MMGYCGTQSAKNRSNFFNPFSSVNDILVLVFQ